MVRDNYVKQGQMSDLELQFKNWYVQTKTTFFSTYCKLYAILLDYNVIFDIVKLQW